MNKTYKFTEDDMRLLRKRNLDLLLYFQKICKENNLTFFLCGGCCIGAIRHQGFIPWDDDVDVFMPREDYNKLCTIFNQKENSRYEFCSREGRRNLFDTINDSETTFVKALQSDLDTNLGIALDILPLDGCPDNYLKRKIQIFWALLYDLFCAQVVPKNHGNFIAFLGKLLLNIVPSKNIRRKIWKFAEQKMCRYKINDSNFVTELCSGPKYMMIKYPKHIFESAILKDFEGYKMPLPCGYDEYLHMAFGDYETLPPPEKRVMHHDVIFCDLNKSYKFYKDKKAWQNG